MVPFERAFVTSYKPSIVTFPLSLGDSEMLPLLCSSTPLFPTPFLVSPKFPHVPLGVGGWPLGLGLRRAKVLDFQPMWSWSSNVPDGRTDGRHAISIPRCALVHRVVKTQQAQLPNLLKSLQKTPGDVDSFDSSHLCEYKTVLSYCFTAWCSQSAVMRLHFVCLSVCPTVCDVEVCFSHSLEYFENNFVAK